MPRGNYYRDVLPVSAMETRGENFDYRNYAAAEFADSAKSRRVWDGGRTPSKLTKKDARRFAAAARQIRKDASTPGNTYKEVSKSEFQKAHRKRLRDIRKAMGLTTG